jgi:electron transfer flavoprotein alpha subunit
LSEGAFVAENGNALVVIETSVGQVREASLEALAMAGGLVEGVTAVVVGHQVAEIAADVARRGVTRVLTADDPALARYTTDAYTQAVEAAVAHSMPRLVLFAGTTAGRDLGPYLAARAGRNCLSDCIALRWDGDALVGTRPVYQGKMLTDVTDVGSGTHFAVVRAGVVEAPAAESEAAPIEPLNRAVDGGRVQLVDVTTPPAGGANLENAEVIVVGGRGLGSPENFALVEELAAAFNAPVGATRAVTDLGWRPHFEQIGQTGKTVRPKLYIGVGVSGAVQHIVGMQGSETIVAINRDPQAPIFKLAEIGVIGDLNELVPALIAEVRAARGA